MCTTACELEHKYNLQTIKVRKEARLAGERRAKPKNASSSSSLSAMQSNSAECALESVGGQLNRGRFSGKTWMQTMFFSSVADSDETIINGQSRAIQSLLKRIALK